MRGIDQHINDPWMVEDVWLIVAWHFAITKGRRRAYELSKRMRGGGVCHSRGVYIWLFNTAIVRHGIVGDGQHEVDTGVIAPFQSRRLRHMDDTCLSSIGDLTATERCEKRQPYKAAEKRVNPAKRRKRGRRPRGSIPFGAGWRTRCGWWARCGSRCISSTAA